MNLLHVLRSVLRCLLPLIGCNIEPKVFLGGYDPHYGFTTIVPGTKAISIRPSSRNFSVRYTEPSPRSPTCLCGRSRTAR